MTRFQTKSTRWYFIHIILISSVFLCALQWWLTLCSCHAPLLLHLHLTWLFYFRGVTESLQYSRQHLTLFVTNHSKQQYIFLFKSRITLNYTNLQLNQHLLSWWTLLRVLAPWPFFQLLLCYVYHQWSSLPKENKLCSKHFNADNTVISYKLENQCSISAMGKKFFFSPLPPSNWFYPMWVGWGWGGRMAMVKSGPFCNVYCRVYKCWKRYLDISIHLHSTVLNSSNTQLHLFMQQVTIQNRSVGKHSRNKNASTILLALIHWLLFV